MITDFVYHFLRHVTIERIYNPRVSKRLSWSRFMLTDSFEQVCEALRIEGVITSTSSEIINLTERKAYKVEQSGNFNKPKGLYCRNQRNIGVE